MPFWIYPLFSTIVISLISIIGIVFFSLNKNAFSKLMFILFSFAVGGLLGNVFFHLLPESYQQISNTSSIAWLILIGFFVFFIIEYLLVLKKKSEKSSSDVKNFGYLCLYADSLHNFTDGILIGAGWLISPEIGLATTIAVFLHELPQEISDFAILIKAGFAKRKAILYNLYSALSAVLGTVLVLIFNDEIKDFTIYILPFAAGGFIYLAASNLIPELIKNKSKKQAFAQICIVALGLLMMFAINNNHSHTHLDTTQHSHHECNH